MANQNFTSRPISTDLKDVMITQRTWEDGCPISMDRLILLKLKHFDFEGKEQNGEMVVLDVVAENVLTIFRKLHKAKFPIHKIQLISKYSGDDEKAMEDNNSSAFNCRKIANSDKFSIHSYGLAIDINPLQNPVAYTEVGLLQDQVKVNPSGGRQYLNRSNLRPGMVENNYNGKESVITLFRKHGFTIWGGSWNSPIDWHHFQPTRIIADQLANSTVEEGKKIFIQYSDTPL
jgi:D-alanyl-D-alanine carboxypeptidase-like protein